MTDADRIDELSAEVASLREVIRRKEQLAHDLALRVLELRRQLAAVRLELTDPDGGKG